MFRFILAEAAFMVSTLGPLTISMPDLWSGARWKKPRSVF